MEVALQFFTLPRLSTLEGGVVVWWILQVFHVVSGSLMIRGCYSSPQVLDVSWWNHPVRRTNVGVGFGSLYNPPSIVSYLLRYAGPTYGCRQSSRVLCRRQPATPAAAPSSPRHKLSQILLQLQAGHRSGCRTPVNLCIVSQDIIQYASLQATCLMMRIYILSGLYFIGWYRSTNCYLSHTVQEQLGHGDPLNLVAPVTCTYSVVGVSTYRRLFFLYLFYFRLWVKKNMLHCFTLNGTLGIGCPCTQRLNSMALRGCLTNKGALVGYTATPCGVDYKHTLFS